ncbi:M23 family metallopeptidase [Sulfurospirillum sp. 1612]|uniref:M23 family metallopeptidase n=1 Tax=Sulfurospirillum sp. 1612 TaxID=3094835 RepID=UPI002F9403C6
MKSLLLIFVLALYVHAMSIFNGDVALLQFDNNVTVQFEGKRLPVLRHPREKGKFYALVPIAYCTKKAETYLLIDQKKVPLQIKKGAYKTEKIHVSQSKVTPSKKALAQIHKEYQEAYKIYNTITPKRYWNKPFILPLHSHITSAYGNARMFNNTLQSFHSGTDFRAKIGTKVHAANDGVVVIAKKRYYAGGSVVIDHGQGVYSCYYHLSRITVHVGEKITQNEVLGLSGQSGRVNGPHLHFTIMVYAHAINPLQFEKQINALF